MNKKSMRSLFPWLLTLTVLIIAGLACDLPLPDIDVDGSKSLGPNIPQGTYKGVITETEMASGGLEGWKEDGTVISNEIVIDVNEFGKVIGSFLYEKVGNIMIADYSHVSPCISSNDQFFIGTADDYLDSPKGVIVFEIQHTLVRTLTEGCSIGPDVKTIENTYKQHFAIEVTGTTMVGTSVSSEDGHPVKAKFVLEMQ